MLNSLSIPAQFEIFGKRDLLSRSVKKMQLSEADRLSFAFLAEAKQISRKSHFLCDFFVSFFSKKNERKNLYQLRIRNNTVPYKCMCYTVQLCNEKNQTTTKLKMIRINVSYCPLIYCHIYYMILT